MSFADKNLVEEQEIDFKANVKDWKASLCKEKL